MKHRIALVVVLLMLLSGCGANTYANARGLTIAGLQIADASAEDAANVATAAEAAEGIALVFNPDSDGQVDLMGLWQVFGDAVDPEAQLIGELLLNWAIAPDEDLEPPVDSPLYDERWHDFVQTLRGVKSGATWYRTWLDEQEGDG